MKVLDCFKVCFYLGSDSIIHRVPAERGESVTGKLREAAVPALHTPCPEQP